MSEESKTISERMKESKLTIAVDFDGVIHSYTSGWKGAEIISDPPVDGAIDWLNKIVSDYDVVILSTRGDQENSNEAVKTWLRENGYTGPDLLITSHKVPALIYLDDRAIRFTGPGSFPTKEDIFNARPWNKL